jgi:RNA polymerase sigma factor (sigma-70 family)
MTETIDIPALVGRCLQGQSEAFGPLVRQFQNIGYAVAFSYLGNPHDAQDVLQEAFLLAFCRLGQLRDPATFGGWFRAIVVSQCRQWLRRTRRVRQSASTYAAADGPAGASPADQQAARLARREFWERVFALPEPCREVALLHYLSRFSQEEIAEFLQVPLSTVHGRLQQSRARLRRVLNEFTPEEMEMTHVDVTAQMEDLLYQLAAEPLRLELSLAEGDNVVLFCGVNVELEIAPAEDAALILEGSHVALGLSPDAARRNAGQVQVLADQVPDFAAAGPHPGQVFAGTSIGNDGKPDTLTRTTTEQWQQYLDGQGQGAVSLRPAGFFPALAGMFAPFPPELQAALRPAHRITVAQATAASLILPRTAFHPRLQKVFRPTAHMADSLHGPVGRTSLLARLPRGTRLTVFGADRVSARGLQADIFLVSCRHVELAEIDGQAFVLDSPLASATRIRGRLCHRACDFGGVDWESGGAVARRYPEHTCRVADVQGTVDIEVGRADIELISVSGDIAVMNRYGATRLNLEKPLEGTRCRLESVSGAVHLSLAEPLLSQVRLAAVTLCGAIAYEPFRDLDKGEFNSGQLAGLSTLTAHGGRWDQISQAELFVRTESGDIHLEKACRS